MRPLLVASSARVLSVLALAAAVLAPWGASPAAAKGRADKAPAAAKAESPPPFDAKAAWEEFEAEFRLDYAYLDREDFDVDALFARIGAVASAAPDAPAFRRALHRGLLAFTDPHVIVGPLTDADPNVFPTSSDLVVALRGEAYVVVDVRAGSAADTAGVRPGWALATVGGVPTGRAAEALWDGLLPDPTVRQRSYAATLAANGLRGGERDLGFVVDGQPRAVHLANARVYADAVAAMPPVAVEVRDDVAIVRFANSLGDDATIAAFDRAVAENVGRRAIVVDLRNTPSGGNTDVARAIMGHFVTEARPYQMHTLPEVERRTTVPRRWVEYVLPREPVYTGRVEVLGGHWTGSMGEGIVVGMDAAAGADTVASDMGDLLGAMYGIDLPKSGARLDLGAEALFHVDGTPREDFVADVPLPAADRDAAGGDPALAAALGRVGVK